MNKLTVASILNRLEIGLTYLLELPLASILNTISIRLRHQTIRIMNLVISVDF